ncbi:hypothetical protein D3C81_1637980 [compost metagenome]
MLGHADLLEMAEAQHARAVEQQPQLAIVAAAEVRQGGFDGGQVSHIQRLVPDVTQGGGLGSQGLGVAVHQPHPPATVVEQTCRRSADAGGGAGDQDVVHVMPPFPRAGR